MLFIPEDFVHQWLPLGDGTYCREDYWALCPRSDLSFLPGLALTAVSVSRAKMRPGQMPLMSPREMIVFPLCIWTYKVKIFSIISVHI